MRERGAVGRGDEASRLWELQGGCETLAEREWGLGEALTSGDTLLCTRVFFLRDGGRLGSGARASGTGLHWL